MEMDFDLTKENIQPLPGGRNVQQLGIALQAQNSREVQHELQQQREEFENAIEHYQGEDPLDNYYHYISWIEQSYPKNGHEGNLVPLLEHCLSKFENDKRYTNDRRFCKLWIKYIDLQNNPLELYQMMHAKGLCVGCADLYRAWAYYHEANNDFPSANQVFGLGKNALAQPYDELETAHTNLVIAAGEHTIYGPNENSLVSKRQALTSLHTYQPGRVGSVRIASSSNPGTFPVAGSSTRPNAPIPVYEERSGISRHEAVPPTSIIKAAKRQEVKKENTLKPGPWTTVPVKKRVLAPRKGADFTVHEDSAEHGILLPENHPRETLEDYSKWHVNLVLSEPYDPKAVPMYPKERVYVHPNCEYSIEELRSQRYIKKKPTVMNKDVVEMIFIDDDNQIEDVRCQQMATTSQQQQQSLQCRSGGVNAPFGAVYTPQQAHTSMHHPFQFNEPNVAHTPNTNAMLDIWADSPSPGAVKQTDSGLHFAIYEQSSIQPHAKTQAMKTPIKTLNADDLVETGSRGGMDVAMAAQPEADSAKPMPIFSDDSSSSFDDIRNSVQQQQQQFEMNDSINNTQTFFCNMNKLTIVSTPIGKESLNNNTEMKEVVGSTKKQLFPDMSPETGATNAKLSTILEETKYLGTSSSSGGSGTMMYKNSKSPRNMEAISEEHNSYLAQNLMANAALRSSLLGDFISSPDTSIHRVAAHHVESTNETKSYCQSVKPIDGVPSDPFKPSVISRLLELVQFPGRHVEGYVVCQIPRLVVKKDPFHLGNEYYYIEKQLGKGTYGTVFKGYDSTHKAVALKYQKPINKWEFYICRELRARLSESPLRDRFMDVSIGYFGDQCSVLVSDYMPYGSLLDIANLVKQKVGRTMKESLCIYFCIEMLKIVRAMHQVQIIHADIKPDNFLAYLLPNNMIGLQLIDFGCSIDMSLFPPNAMFTRKVTTEDFVCCEMRDGRPWSYHTDLFCIAATAHVLLYDKYIQLRKTDDLWSLTTKYLRYWRQDVWNMFFSNLLNQQNGIADAFSLELLMEDTLKTMQSEFHSEMRLLLNMLKRR